MAHGYRLNVKLYAARIPQDRVRPAPYRVRPRPRSLRMAREPPPASLKGALVITLWALAGDVSCLGVTTERIL